MVKIKGLVVEAYEWDEEDVSSDENEMTKVKVLMALANDESVVMEQRSNRVLKHRDLVQELNTYKEQLLVVKQAKLDFLTTQHVNKKILKENKNLRKELKELTTITKTWLNSSNKVNQCIYEQIPSQKKIILGLDQLTEDPSSFRKKDLVFVESSADDIKVSITGVKQPWLFESKATEYDSADESSILLAKGNKNSLASKNNSAFASKLKNVKTEDESLLGKALQAKKSEAFQSSNATRSKTPTKRVRAVYVLDMTSTQESCFFAKATENLNWLWHKRLAYLNFKTIDQLAKQNLVIGLPSLVYLKDKPCHHVKREITIESALKQNRHLLSRNVFIFFAWIYLDLNSILVNFCDERGISQNFSSPYTHEQNGVAVRKNRTFIESARTMLSGSVLSKQYWTEAVAIACYTQNRSTIIKRYLKTPYEIFHGRIPNSDFLHVFGCPVYIHNHKDYLGKFDEKADDG
ncbi:retrovirus-related pol polyprotein from transposon TNT 1-94 [Tanacetum coccineum]